MPAFNQVNVIVKDMKATVDFYRRLGLEIGSDGTEVHVEVKFPNGMTVEFDTVGSVHVWDSGWNGAVGSGVVIGLAFESRDAIDAVYRDVTAAGGKGRQPPFDAFWGGRYAVVEDPDGNGVGLMSPIDAERKYWPPKPPPKA